MLGSEFLSQRSAGGGGCGIAPSAFERGWLLAEQLLAAETCLDGFLSGRCEGRWNERLRLGRKDRGFSCWRWCEKLHGRSEGKKGGGRWLEIWSLSRRSGLKAWLGRCCCGKRVLRAGWGSALETSERRTCRRLGCWLRLRGGEHLRCRRRCRRNLER